MIKGINSISGEPKHEMSILRKSNNVPIKICKY